MTREIVMGNGKMLVALDDCLRVREFFFPNVGMENHLAGHAMRIGVWTENKFSWVGEGWKFERSYLPDTRVSDCHAKNPQLGIELDINDAVHSSLAVFLREIVIRNTSANRREIRLFFSHDFHIYGLDSGDTAFYYPETNSIIHYKGQRYFLINGITAEGNGIHQFATGVKEAFGMEGTWKDAEDGVLSCNPIAQGSVDSVVSFRIDSRPESENQVHYWIACGKKLEDVESLNSAVLKTGVGQLLLETENYWSAWINKRGLDLNPLPHKVIRLFRSSLQMIRMHADNAGGIIASCDSDVLKFNRDTYAYVWPRDGAIAAMALDMAGFEEVSRLFFQYCDRVISKNGFFYHKYSTDGSQGSSWHSWVDSKGQSQLPIQEDETALVLIALGQHYQKYRDLEFIARVHSNLVVKAGDFLLGYIDEKTGLPKASFDVWEEKNGVFTATAATVHSALMAASKFASVFFDRPRQKVFSQAAARMKEGMLKYLFDPESNSFLKAIYPDGSKDKSADSSLSFIFEYGPFQATEEVTINTMRKLIDRLWIPTPNGGMARYENDEYFRADREFTGNPWSVCTLWLARWRIAVASNAKDLEMALNLIMQTTQHASESGVLGEQTHPVSGQPISVSPLLWSHSEYVLTIYQYLKKYRSLNPDDSAG